MKHWISTFRSYIENLDEEGICDWLLSGMQLYSDESSKCYQRADLAFKNGQYGFGLLGLERSIIDELQDVWQCLESIQPARFGRGLALAIDRIDFSLPAKREAFSHVLELSIEIKNDHSIDALINKLKLIDEEGLDVVYSNLAYMLHEMHDQPKMLKLGRAIILRNYPYQISAHLLMGLCSLDLENSVEYAKAIQAKLERQIDYIQKNIPESYEKLKFDFSTVVFNASEDSAIISDLIGIPLYAELLKSNLRVELDNSLIKSLMSWCAYKTWKLHGLAYAVMRKFYPSRSLSAADTKDRIEDFLALQGI